MLVTTLMSLLLLKYQYKLRHALLMLRIIDKEMEINTMYIVQEFNIFP